MVTVHAPVPLHPPPDHPPKLDPGSGEAVNVTIVPPGTLCEQVATQAIPPPETLPEPVPAIVTVSVCASGGGAVNVAVTDFAALIVTVHLPVPVHPAPDQPPKLEPDPGDAVNVTVVPDAKLCEQVLEHTIPAPETLPEPRPAKVTVSVCAGGGHDRKVRVALTLRPSAALAVIERTNLPVARPVSLPTSERLIVLKCRPLMLMLSATQVTCRTLRNATVSPRPLTHVFADGMLNADAAEIRAWCGEAAATPEPTIDRTKMMDAATMAGSAPWRARTRDGAEGARWGVEAGMARAFPRER
jgi:hypothetical protein